MSDILSEIDDTLADWHGSADSMHWRPVPQQGTNQDGSPITFVCSPSPDEARAILDRMTATMAPVVRTMTETLIPAIKHMNETLLPLARALGYLPPEPRKPSKLDARYRQRQKNRRKRKH